MRISLKIYFYESAMLFYHNSDCIVFRNYELRKYRRWFEMSKKTILKSKRLLKTTTTWVFYCKT